MKKLLYSTVAIILTSIMLGGCGYSVSDIQDTVKESMIEKGLSIKEVTLTKTGENTYHGLAKDSDGDMHSVDVSVTDNGDVMWEVKE